MYRLIDNIADLEVEISAQDLGQLADNTIRAFYQLVVPAGGITAAREHRLAVAGENREDLFYNLLNELVYLFDTQHFLAAEQQVLLCTNRRLQVVLLGEAFVPGRHQCGHLIKAVTLHGFRIIGSQELVLHVVFDV